MKQSIAVLCSILWVAPVWAQDFAAEQLESSPRHHEWVEVPANGRANGRTVHSFVAYPEHDESTLAVIVIHENRGLTDWERSVADRLAEAGYLAIAPDLLSEFDAEHSRTSDFESSDAARNALYELDASQVQSDLLAVQEYIAQDAASNGTTVVMGFCWGGAQAFRLATNAPDLAAALVFYGTPPDEEGIASISAPVYGFYAENDERINATIPETEALMEEHGKVYEYEMYDGAGHAFMRRGADPEGSAENRAARDASWERLLQILSEMDS